MSEEQVLSKLLNSNITINSDTATQLMDAYLRYKYFDLLLSSVFAIAFTALVAWAFKKLS